jgi:thioredoxin reductase (NADPH)
MNKSTDVLIIGKGPAGIQAALYTARAGLKTLIVSNSYGALEYSEHIGNFYGFPDGIKGSELLERGISQGENLKVEFLDGEVTAIEPFDGFTVKGSVKDGDTFEIKAKVVLLASGKVRNKPKIMGLAEFEGKGISYCAICDGFLYRNMPVGIIGNGEFALAEARELINFTKDITIFTNNQNEAANFEGFKVERREIQKIYPSEDNNKIGGILLADNEKIPLNCLFIASGSASAADFARKIGIMLNGNAIAIDSNMMTNVKGLFAAGDCTGGFAQIAVAVGQGAIAGQAMVSFLKSQK